jgi:hypothetical protein
MNKEAFISGYQQGHDGKPPIVPSDMMERLIEDLSSETPLGDNDWVWRLIGWGIGQLVAMHELAR